MTQQGLRPWYVIVWTRRWTGEVAVDVKAELDKLTDSELRYVLRQLGEPEGFSDKERHLASELAVDWDKRRAAEASGYSRAAVNWMLTASDRKAFQDLVAS